MVTYESHSDGEHGKESLQYGGSESSAFRNCMRGQGRRFEKTAQSFGLGVDESGPVFHSLEKIYNVKNQTLCLGKRSGGTAGYETWMLEFLLRQA